MGAYDAALHSPSLNCSRPFNDTAVTRFPRDETQFARLVAHNRTAAASCVEGSGDLIGNLDAANQARDAEALRAALGEAKLSWFAWTYGNLVAQTYAKLYPGRVRAMVVDSPLDHHGVHIGVCPNPSRDHRGGIPALHRMVRPHAVWLGHVQPRGGASEVELFGDRDEQSHVPEKVHEQA